MHETMTMGFSDVKEEVRTSNQKIMAEVTTQLTSVRHEMNLSQSAIYESVKELQVFAGKLEARESRFEDVLQQLRERERNGTGDPDVIEQQLQEISKKLEVLSLQNAKGFSMLASGRLQCPRLCILWPMRGPRRLGVKRLIYKEYRLFFLCAHDSSIVKTSVKIKHVRVWLQKIAPFLKFALFSIRVLVSVYGIPIPALPDFIPGNVSDEKFNEVVGHMEALLEDIDPGALSTLRGWLDQCLEGENLQEFIRNREKEIPPEVYGAIAVEAYKPKNRGWMEEMEIASRGSIMAWVKKDNVDAFQRAGT